MPVPVSVPCPDGWREQPPIGDEVARFVDGEITDRPAPAFSAAVRPQPSREHVAEVRARHAKALLAELGSPRLLDQGIVEVDDRPASRVLIVHESGGDDLILEQWEIPVPGQSIVLTVTALAADHASNFEAFHDLLGTVAIDG